MGCPVLISSGCRRPLPCTLHLPSTLYISQIPPDSRSPPAFLHPATPPYFLFLLRICLQSAPLPDAPHDPYLATYISPIPLDSSSPPAFLHQETPPFFIFLLRIRPQSAPLPYAIQLPPSPFPLPNPVTATSDPPDAFGIFHLPPEP